MATGVTAFAYDEGSDGISQKCNVKTVVFSWTSTSGGAAADTSRKIVGRIVKAQIVPSGTAAPTNGYSCVITDSNGVNILTNTQKNLTSLSNSSTEERYLLVLDGAGTPLAQSLHPIVCDPLTFTISSAGNAKSGTVTLYYVPA